MLIFFDHVQFQLGFNYVTRTWIGHILDSQHEIGRLSLNDFENFNFIERFLVFSILQPQPQFQFNTQQTLRTRIRGATKTRTDVGQLLCHQAMAWFPKWFLM